MDGVKSVGSEFYGTSSSVPFPSLEALSFSEMTEWEEWIPCGAGQEVDEVFPKLRMLSLDNCCKLQGTLPRRLLLLETLDITSCDQLLVTIQCLPALRELRIYGCKRVVFSSPHLVHIAVEVVLSGLFEQGLPKLESLEIDDVQEQTYLWRSKTRLLQDVRSLNRLQISSCPRLLSLVTEEEHDRQQPELPCRLRFLELRNCGGLTRLPQALLTLSSLTEMQICGCASLVSFPEAALPSQLRTVEIEDCNALESLPEAWMHNSNSSLESLKIRSCNSLVSFPEVALPSQLRSVVIEECDALESLPEAWMHNELPATLEHLQVVGCWNLAFLSRNGNLPQSLKYLRVRFCSKLESLAERLDNTSLEKVTIRGLENLKSLPAGFHNLHHLQKISISRCPNLELFPEEGLPSTKLTELKIWECDNLKALPNCMHNLTSLLNLEIRWCPSVVSFPEDDFPTSLRRLTITGGCPDLVSSPPFPTSLTELWISDMPDLECLSSIGENLTSLETLRLSYCPKLTYFPEQGLPKSLFATIYQWLPVDRRKVQKG